MIRYSQVRSYVKIFCLLFIAIMVLGFQTSPLPTFSQSFTPNTIGVGNTSTLTFDIYNGGTGTVEDLAFSNTLPAGLVVASEASATTTCDNGVVVAPEGGSSITFDTGRLGSNSGCTITVSVTGSAPGTHTNVSGDLTSDAGNSGNSTADLTIDAGRANFSKSFSPDSINYGEISTLTLNIENNTGTDFTQMTFSDALPAGLQIVNPAQTVNTCTGGTSVTFSADPNTNIISLSAFGLAFPGYEVLKDGQSCTITVEVTGAVGIHDNLTSDLSTGTGVSAGKATDTLEIKRVKLVLEKSFTDDPIVPGNAATLEFTITNLDRGNSASNIAFTDNLNDTLTGLVATSLPANGFCGAGSQLTGSSTLSMTGGSLESLSSCTFSVTVQVPGGATPGTYTNTSSEITGDIAAVGQTGNRATDYLVVAAIPVLTKTFVNNPVEAGGTVTLEFTITNVSPTSTATDITFEDAFATVLPTAVSVPAADFCGTGSTATFTPLINPPPPSDSTPAKLSIAGANLALGTSCTFSITLDIATDASNGIYDNSTSALTAFIDGATVTGEPATDSLNIVAAPDLTKSFSDAVIPGGTVDLIFTIIHDAQAPGDATDINFTDDLDATLTGLTAIGLPISDVCGTGSQLSGTTNLSFTGGTLAAGESCTFSATLQLPASASSGNHTNTTSNVSATVQGLTPTGNAATADLSVAGLSHTKTFLDNPALRGSAITLEFEIVNASTVQTATDIFFTDNLNNMLSGLTATDLPKTDICGSGSQLFATGSLLIFTGGNLLPGTSCTFTTTLQLPAGAADGSYINTTSNLTANINGSSVLLNPAVDSLTIIGTEILLFSKNLSTLQAFPGETISLEFSLTNAASTNVTDIAFNDDLEAFLTDLTAVALPSNDVCGLGSLLSGSDVISLSGGSLAAGATCTFSVTLQVPATADAGIYINTTGQPTGDLNGTSVSGNVATDELEVVETGTIVIDKITGPTGDLTNFDFTMTGGPLSENRSFIIADADEPRSNVVLLGSGYNLAETPLAGWNLVSASCDDGSPVNNIDVGLDETVTCTFYNLADGGEVLTFAKNFGSLQVAPGDTVTLEFSLTNSFAAGTATDITFTDDLNAALTGLTAIGLPANDVCGAGSQISGTDFVTLSGATLAPSNTCTFSLTLQVPALAIAGNYTNTTNQPSATIDGISVSGNIATDDLEVISLTTSGTIIIDKVTTPTGDPTSFDFTLTGGGQNQSFSLTDTDPPQNIVVLSGAGYSVAETVSTGWNLTSASCDDGSPVDNIDVGDNETVTCTFYNEAIMEGPACKLYAVHDKGLQNSQFFAVDFMTLEEQVNTFGPLYKKADIEALDIDPINRQLYAVKSYQGNADSELYTVDTVTGDLTLVGRIRDAQGNGFEEVDSLSFHPDGTLWGYAYVGVAKRRGLLKIDPQTAVTEVVYQSKKYIAAIAWSPDGSVLWLTNENKLFTYVPGGSFVKQSIKLPGEVEGLEFRPDGLLLVGLHTSNSNHDEITIYAIDVNSGQIILTDSFNTGNLGDVESMAWPDWCPVYAPAPLTANQNVNLSFTNDDGDGITLAAPKGTVTEDTTLAYTQLNDLSGSNFAGHSFRLNAYQDGSQQEQFSFQQPVVVRIDYSDADVAGLDEQTLTLEYWDREQKQWFDAACNGAEYERHPAENWLFVPICHLTEFALFAASGGPVAPVYLPIIVVK